MRFVYLGHTFEPYAKIISQLWDWDAVVRYIRIANVQSLLPIKNTSGDFEVDKFYNRFIMSVATNNAADVYYCIETTLYYVPLNDGIFEVDVESIREHLIIFNEGQ